MGGPSAPCFLLASQGLFCGEGGADGIRDSVVFPLLFGFRFVILRTYESRQLFILAVPSVLFFNKRMFCS